MLTTQTAAYLNDAYAYLNKHLFNGELPTPLITLSRKKGALGYYFYQAFQQDGNKIDEVALTPSSLSRSTLESLSTLAHEQCHAWQFHFGKPGENAYHNKQWANKMLAIGLQPFSVTDSTKMTGYKCSHTINDNGLFLPVAKKFIELRGELPVQTTGNAKVKMVKVNHRPKLVCPICKNSFTIPGTVNVTIQCNDCQVEMETL